MPGNGVRIEYWTESISFLLENSAVLLKTDLSGNFTNVKKSDISKILEREPELEKKLTPFLKKYEKPDIDLIAITNGPGLEPCLWVGVNFAKALSYFWDIPIVPVNHIESHILVNYLDLPAQAGNKNIKLPAIALVVSGGHTQIILMKKIGEYEVLGETRDDAAGECFDKAAKILGLGYPGGPIIAKLADRDPISIINRDRVSIQLPRPMINSKDYDFSFSGLKTAIFYVWKKIKLTSNFSDRSTRELIQIQMAKEIQQAIIDVLLKKTLKAAKDYKAKSIILGGGVSANQELRKQFAWYCESQRSNLNLIFPELNLSTDNGLMTAITGFYHRRQKITPSASLGRFLRKIEADGNLRIK